MSTRRSLARLLTILGLVASLAVPFVVDAQAATSTITARGPARSVSYASESTRTLILSVPSGARTGDVLVASLGFGRSGANSQPALTAPPGWNLVRRTNQGRVAALAVYWHVLGAGEATFTWTTDVKVGGAAFLAAFSGVDPTNPIDASAGRTTTTRSATLATPSVTTSVAGDALLAGFFAYNSGGRATTWGPPGGMAELGDATNGSSRSGSLDVVVQATAGPSGAKTATASTAQDYGVAVLTALRPAATPTTTTTTTTLPPPPPSGAVPLIVDTDIFSDADDVGALATAFALQLRSEARVIAIGVNTRTSRPSVATNSWRCAAAVAQFYGAGNTPIGTHKPDNGTATNTDEFVGPCATRAAPNTPTPDTAVRVFRRALAGEADGSVVMVEAGYSGNLADLLNSPADAISPLTGRDLVARKVRELVIMAGGYPSRSGENNLIGDVPAAQDVADHWPTRIVWSGYEVGDEIHTGDTITGIHPSTSPVRISYEAFVGPNKWIYSYDLTAVYEAVRPSDPLLTRVGPGRNTVTGTGGNTFTTGSGNQYYLRLTNATALDDAIEALLDTLPGTVAPPPPPPPPPAGPGPSDTFDGNTLDPARWVTTSYGSTVAATNQELAVTHPAGPWTTGVVQSVSPHDQRGRALQVQVRRAANDGLGGTRFGETSVFLQRDATHYAEFFIASGRLTAWTNTGSGEVNLTPTWPAYTAAAMQWLRFRESGGTLFWEYAAGTSAPGPWTVLASRPTPFAVDAVTLRIVAGSNQTATDVARIDNIATT